MLDLEHRESPANVPLDQALDALEADRVGRQEVTGSSIDYLQACRADVLVSYE